MASDPTVPVRCNQVQVGPVNNLSPGNGTCGTPATYAELYMRFWMQIDPAWQMPVNTPVNIAVFSVEALRLVQVGGVYYLKDAGNRQGTHPLGNTWHAIEIHSKACSTNPCTTNDGVIEVSLDGALDISTYTQAFLWPLGASTSLGLDNVSTSTGSLYFDDVVVSTAPIGAPALAMTVRRPNTAARTGMPFDVTLYGQASTDVLSASVDNSVVYTKAGAIQGRERFTITGMGAWTAGDHSLTVQLASATGAVKATFSDTLHKYKNGTPTVSIDESNAIVVGGQKYFTVGMFADGIAGEWSTWTANNAVNTYCCSDGFQNNYAYTPMTMSGYLGQLSPSLAILPDENWTGRGSIGGLSVFAGVLPTAVSTVTSYVTGDKGKANLLMWTWGDENDMGPGEGRNPVSRSFALTDATHKNDPDHPVFQNLLGYEKPQIAVYHGRYYPNIPNSRDWTADVYSTDTYPITYQAVPNTNWTIKKWVLYIDRVNRYTFGLAPIFQFVEMGTNNRTGTSGCCYGPTGAQILMETWLGVIHGLKGINWWSAYVNVSADQWQGCATFVQQIGALQSVILGGTPRPVTSNQTADGARVDAAAWDASRTTTYVFAARLSEVNEMSQPAISTSLTVAGIGNTVATVYGENRTVPVVGGIIVDQFAPAAVHIYQVPKPAGLRRPAVFRLPIN
jgi:hypothetical protein